jgi:hypothetical protein
MKKVDWSTSTKVADIVDSQIGECVANVARAMLDFRNILPEDAVYVEGLWKIGGQLACHAWIDTSDSIIDPTLVRETNHQLRETVEHYPIQTYSTDQLRRRFGNRPRGPGVRLKMELDWDDPRVERLSKEVDPP